MKTRSILMCLALIGAPPAFCGPPPAIAQYQNTGNTFTFTPVAGRVPSQDARIKDYGTGVTPYASNGQTGNLLVRYSDGTTVLAWRAPDKKVIMPSEGSAEDDEQTGADQIRVAKDGRTIGWAEMAAACCESYPLPISVGVYQSGKRVLHVGGPGMLDYWSFLDKGRSIVAVWGPVHGPQVLEYQIIDLKTQQVTASVAGNPQTQHLDPDAPAWALQAQTTMQERR